MSAISKSEIAMCDASFFSHHAHTGVGSQVNIVIMWSSGDVMVSALDSRLKKVSVVLLSG